jgi:hypothetical protein
VVAGNEDLMRIRLFTAPVDEVGDLFDAGARSHKVACVDQEVVLGHGNMTV